MQLLISGSYNVFSEGFNCAGVYLASGLNPSSSFASPIYIGSSIDLQRRIARQHIPELTCGIHKNPPLNNYAVKYGIESLVWFLIEPCPIDKTLEREQYYLDYYKPFADLLGGFNISHDARAATKGLPRSEETKRRISAGKTGKKRPDVAVKNAANCKSCRLISPSGKVFNVTNISRFCRENRLCISSVCTVVNGTYSQYKGWRLAPRIDTPAKE